MTRQDMQDWMPEVRPAQPLALEADGALTELPEAIRHRGREALGQVRRLLYDDLRVQTREDPRGRHRH